MPSRILVVAGTSLAALAAATTLAGAAGAGTLTGHARVHHGAISSHTVPTGKGTCYTNQSGDTGVHVSSANYSDDTADNTSGAVDFSVKATCTIKKVTTTGVYYNGAGPASSVNVIFYKDKRGEPGRIVNEQDNLGYTDSSGTGDLAATIKTVKLTKGSFFVAVVANMTLSAGGQWGWELTMTQKGTPDQWENEGGGFGVCPTWGDVLTCVGFGNDFMVTLAR